MKKIGLCLVGLILVFAFARTVETNSDVRSYNPIADLNRDGKIDIKDIAKVAIAYGSTKTLPIQPNQTLVYIYQLETDPPEVQNARVAIIDPNYYYRAVQVKYTNSSGIVNFTLDPNSNYTAIAWSDTTYNYANFTTNEFDEASVAIQLGYPQLPPNWVTITLTNKTTEELWSVEHVFAMIGELVYNSENDCFKPIWKTSILFPNFTGVLVIGPWDPTNPTTEPGKSYCVMIGTLEIEVTTVYTPDENGNANIITYI